MVKALKELQVSISLGVCTLMQSVCVCGVQHLCSPPATAKKEKDCFVIQSDLHVEMKVEKVLFHFFFFFLY